MTISLAVGLLILSRSPRHPSNIGFALGMGTLMLIEFGNALIMVSPENAGLLTLGARLSFVGQIFLPACWFLFSLTFARVNYRGFISRWSPAIVGLWLLSAFFSYWFIASDPLRLTPLGARAFSEGTSLQVTNSFWSYLHSYLLVGLLLNIVHLEATLLSSKAEKRNEIKFLVIGVGATLAFFLYLSTLDLLFTSFNTGVIPVTSAVIFISSVMIALFTVKNRLLDVDIYISRDIIFNSVTLLLLGLYLLVTGMVVYGIKYFNIPFDYFFSNVLTFIAIVVLVIISLNVKFNRKIQHFINRHFYRHKYDFKGKWMESIEKLNSKRSIDDINEALTEMISTTMGAGAVYIWIFDPSTKSYYSAIGHPGKEFERVRRDHPVIKEIQDNPVAFQVKDLHEVNTGRESQTNGIEGLLNAVNAVLYAPLKANGDVVGFLLIGEDVSGEQYGNEDFELLNALTTQVAAQIKNIRLTEDLVKVKEFEAFHRMSTFIMHDLKNLINSLSLVSQNAKDNMDNPEFQKDAIRSIDGTVERMGRVIEKLSTVRKNIHLRKNETDMEDVVRRVLKHTASPEGKDIRIDFVPSGRPLPRVRVDCEAIEMVILNLVLNSFDAIKDNGVVRVGVSLNGSYMKIKVKDDGQGMSADYIKNCLFRPFKSTKKRGAGVGVYQCKAVVEAHGGEIEVDSEVNSGTTFTVRLPLE